MCNYCRGFRCYETYIGSRPSASICVTIVKGLDAMKRIGSRPSASICVTIVEGLDAMKRI